MEISNACSPPDLEDLKEALALNGAYPNADAWTKKKELTPLLVLCRCRGGDDEEMAECAKLLIEYRADVSWKDEDGNAALATATEYLKDKEDFPKFFSLLTFVAEKKGGEATIRKFTNVWRKKLEALKNDRGIHIPDTGRVQLPDLTELLTTLKEIKNNQNLQDQKLDDLNNTLNQVKTAQETSQREIESQFVVLKDGLDDSLQSEVEQLIELTKERHEECLQLQEKASQQAATTGQSVEAMKENLCKEKEESDKKADKILEMVRNMKKDDMSKKLKDMLDLVNEKQDVQEQILVTLMTKRGYL